MPPDWSVGNIPPGQEVKIEIAYVDVLRYDVGSYEFHFPMVVGPRYNPGAPIASPTPTPKELQGKVSLPEPDTNVVPDASTLPCGLRLMASSLTIPGAPSTTCSRSRAAAA